MIAESLPEFDSQDPEYVPGTNYLRPYYAFGANNPTPGDETRAVAAGWTKGGTWIDQHNDINAINKRGRVDIVFLGDSITQSWGGRGRNVAATAGDVWAKYFSVRNAVNFGISGDTTENVLWRIEHGNFDGIDPSLIVVNIGTNNLATSTPQEIA